MFTSCAFAFAFYFATIERQRRHKLSDVDGGLSRLGQLSSRLHTVKVHHLNCGTMYPFGCGEMVCHVLLVETDNGLVLIDTGFGSKDCGDPRGGWDRRGISSAQCSNPTEAAVNQVEQLGFRRDDVRHIVITHFDGDHIGGISDFPEAQIHVTAAEAFGALQAPTRGEKFRFRAVQWAHGPKIVEHTPDGEKWRGFAAAKELVEVSPGIVMISLPDTPGAMPAWRLTPATAGCCIAATPTFTTGRSTGQRQCRVRSPPSSGQSRSTERWCGRITIGLASCTAAANPRCSWSAHTTARCTSMQRPRRSRPNARHIANHRRRTDRHRVGRAEHDAGISRWAPGPAVTMDSLGTMDPNGVGAIRRIASPGPGPDIVE